MVTLCHLSRLVEVQADKFGGKTAIAFRDAKSGKWTPVTWTEFDDIVRATSKALIEMGVEKGERIAVFSDNMPQCFYVNFGCYGAGVVVIPFYANSSTEQAHYMITDAEIRIVFVGGQRQYDTVYSLMPICSGLERIIIFDRNVAKHSTDRTSIYFDDFLSTGNDDVNSEILKQRKNQAQLSDICDILYTSGTTGNSKGVVLTYDMYYNAIKGNAGVLPLTDKDICLNFLPYTHVLERGWSYLGLSIGAVQVVNQNPSEALASMQQIRPTCMCTVPRFWEKIYEGIVERVQNRGVLKRKLPKNALVTSRKVYEDYITKQKSVPIGLGLKYKFYDTMVYSVIRKTLGLDRANFFPTAGATISHEIETFVHSCGMKRVEG